MSSVEEAIALNALKSACSKKKYQSFKDLEHGEYIVNHFSIIETSHGPRVRIDLDDKYMYLPERFVKTIGSHIDVLNKSSKVMVYSGKDSSDRDRLILDFRGSSYFADLFDYDTNLAN